MAFFFRTWAMVHIVARRLLAQFGLAFVTIIGLVASITLVVSIPVYTDAVYHRTFLEKMSLRSSQSPGLSPFSFMFNYYGGWSGIKQWEDVQPLDQYFRQNIAAALNMPLERIVRYFATDSCELYPSGLDLSYSVKDQRLTWVNIGTMPEIEQHIEIVEGTLPAPAELTEDSVINVLISLPLANKIGIQTGETYQLLATSETETGNKVTKQLKVRIAGVWQPSDNQDPFWMFSASNLMDVLLVPEETFINRISPSLYGEIYTAVWYMVMNGSKISTDDVTPLLGRIGALNRQAANLLPNVKVSRAPTDLLVSFQKSVRQLTVLLYAFAIPVLGLILAFISLVANLTVERKRNEIAVTRSRGATAVQVLGSIILESAILGGIALLISLPTSLLLTRLIGQTRTFMDFTAPSNLQPQLTRPAIISGLIAVGVAMLATLSPAIGAVRHTIVSYKQERARQNRRPFWQRAYLDILLMLPSGYGAYLLSRQGSILTGSDTDPLSNPLLFLVPSLAVFALTLFLLRLIPPIMEGIAWIAGRTRFVGLLLAARQLSRAPGYYSIPLIILVFTLSLSAYTASLSRTLDQHLVARTYYKIGADMKFLEVGESPTQAPFPVPGQSNSLTPEFFFFPVTEYLKIPGVQAVTRVGEYPLLIEASTSVVVNGRFYGIDRLDFPQVAYWRRDFAQRSLGDLMNALGANPEGVLVPRSFLQQRGLKIGDVVRLTVATDLGRVLDEARIVGSFNYFPTWYEGQEDVGPLFVGNLDYIFNLAGGESPYRVWVKAKPNLDYTKTGDFELRDLNFRVVTWNAAIPIIDEEQQRPEQQGVFGFLFIGFVAAAVLTVVGFLLYALFSYQRRFIELGVLRAGGLSRGQMALYLAFELIFLILVGAGAGTALGAWISRQFIPYLQFGSDVTAHIPPFQIIIAWDAVYQIYILFAALFGVTLLLLIFLLLRMKIFQAIKLGETV